MTALSVVWFRLDLRLGDNPALAAAAARGRVVPVFIWAPEEEAPWSPGSASRWWLHQSLKSLEASLRALGSRLVVRRGPSLEVLPALARETGATAVFWNRRYEPATAARDSMIKEVLRAKGLEAQDFNSALLHEPWTVRNRSGKPFQVFTPFWRHCLAKGAPGEPLAAPRRLTGPARWPRTLALAELGLEPRIKWTDGLAGAWRPGEAGAQAGLDRFVEQALAAYGRDRDRPDLAGTSRLSPHLHFGEVSPRQVWHAARGVRRVPAKNQFFTELGWREFAHHLLHHFPQTPEQPLRGEFARFPWRRNDIWLGAWQRGQTGYPLVDAGMRELWATGWMHNRARMVAASFLVKHLLISWAEGARWFWDTLVDADLANNTLGWQWTAGCGADAAPYFRVFNPVGQGEKFDPEGSYVRQWVPALADLPQQWLHQPHDAPGKVLAQAGVELGRTYPQPVVSHFIARDVALEAYAGFRKRLKGSGN